MKISLIAPITRRRASPMCYPMGLACVAGSLLEAGHEVEVLDLDIKRTNEVETEDAIKNLRTDAVGIGGLISTYGESKKLTQMVKRYHPDTPVVIGGRMAASSPELWLEKTPADYLVDGEGELTAVELFHALERGEDLIDVKGIWYREGDKYIKTLPRPYAPDLDALARPAYHLFDIESYVRNWEDWSKGSRPIMMITCRGCVVLCSFCYQGFGGFRQRSVESFVSEVEFVMDAYGIDSILFGDSTFMVNKKFVEGFCEELIRRDLKLKWFCASRVSDLSEKHRDLLKLMKAAGCAKIHFGVESGSPAILKGLKKGTTVEAAEVSIRMAREVGINVHTTYVYGLPGETEETVEETVQFCRRNLTPTTFFFATAYPETELYSQALGQGKIEDEEAFVSSLGDVIDFSLNLSDIPDDKFIQVKADAERRTKLPLLVYMFRYWQNYGTRNLARYLMFVWESYPTGELLQRLSQYLKPGSGRSSQWIGKGQVPRPDHPTSTRSVSGEDASVQSSQNQFWHD